VCVRDREKEIIWEKRWLISYNRAAARWYYYNIIYFTSARPMRKTIITTTTIIIMVCIVVSARACVCGRVYYIYVFYWRVYVCFKKSYITQLIEWSSGWSSAGARSCVCFSLVLRILLLLLRLHLRFLLLVLFRLFLLILLILLLLVAVVIVGVLRSSRRRFCCTNDGDSLSDRSALSIDVSR